MSSKQNKNLDTIYVLDEPKLTNRSATRFFINLNHEAVEDLRNALRYVLLILLQNEILTWI